MIWSRMQAPEAHQKREDLVPNAGARRPQKREELVPNAGTRSPQKRNVLVPNAGSRSSPEVTTFTVGRWLLVMVFGGF